MSDLIADPTLSNSTDCPAFSAKPTCQKIPTRIAQIGDGLTIRRALPHRNRRMIGAWCFLDHFGPLDLHKTNGLQIAPHPHMGLQTFTWTLEGEILHRDSLGSQQIIQPGQVNLMTAGCGISHSEESLPDSILHGIQLWIALPDEERNRKPDFIHYPSIPTLNHDGFNLFLLAGEIFGIKAPTKTYSKLIGLDLHSLQNTSTLLPLEPTFEYGILPLVGNVEVENQPIAIDSLLYLGSGRSTLSLRAQQGTRLLVIGGEPFKEEILIWWNFVARTKKEMVEAAKAWEQHTHFGNVLGYQGIPIKPPNLV